MTAMSLAEKFVKRAKGCFLIRVWVTSICSVRVVHIIIIGTFTPKDNEAFKEDCTFICEAEFRFGQKVFRISNPNLRCIQLEDLDKILSTVPFHLLDDRDGFMFSSEHDILIKKERLLPFIALALLEQKLAPVPLEEYGSNLAFARNKMCEMLNRVNSDSWLTIHSLIG
jgi:hypothetical protein